MSRVNTNTSDSRRYCDWIARAGEDMLSAKVLKASGQCNNNAAFHCQQAIEKALKAYILLKSDNLLDGHNLPWLCQKATKYDRNFYQWLDESVSLNRCYIETRYPADLPLNLTSRQVDTYVRMAGEMYDFISGEIEGFLKRAATKS